MTEEKSEWIIWRRVADSKFGATPHDGDPEAAVSELKRQWQAEGISDECEWSSGMNASPSVVHVIVDNMNRSAVKPSTGWVPDFPKQDWIRPRKNLDHQSWLLYRRADESRFMVIPFNGSPEVALCTIKEAWRAEGLSDDCQWMTVVGSSRTALYALKAMAAEAGLNLDLEGSSDHAIRQTMDAIADSTEPCPKSRLWEQRMG